MNHQNWPPLRAWKTLCARLLVFVAFGAATAQAGAQEFNWARQYPVGTALPEIDASDQNGTRRSFENLKGNKGLLFMLSRSFDW